MPSWPRSRPPESVLAERHAEAGEKRAGFLVGSPLFEQVLFHAIGPPRIEKPLANANLRAYFYLYEL